MSNILAKDLVEISVEEAKKGNFENTALILTRILENPEILEDIPNTHQINRDIEEGNDVLLKWVKQNIYPESNLPENVYNQDMTQFIRRVILRNTKVEVGRTYWRVYRRNPQVLQILRMYGELKNKIFVIHGAE